jgi:uncharacterized integral membrane protein
MILKTINGYILTIASGLVLLAGVVLVALQWGNKCEVTLYGPRPVLNTAAVILCSAVAGWLTPKILRVMFTGIGKIRKARKEYKKL